MESQTKNMVDNSTAYKSVRFGELITKLDAHRITDSEVSRETVNGITTESRVVKIGPSLAESLLLNNHNNRPVTDSNVKKIANAMQTGEWTYNAEPIRFDDDGVLLDGQHRLLALIKSNMTFEFKVITGFSPEIFTTLDVGKTRSGSDILSIAGFDNHRILDHAANFVFKFVTKGSKSHANYKNLTHKELVKFVKSEPFLEESAQFYVDVKKLQNMKILSPKVIAGMHFLLGKKDAFEAKIFLKRLVTGEDNPSDSPIFVLRNRLIDNKMSNKKLNTDDINKLIITAWNKFRDGEKISRLVTPRKTPKIK